MSEPRAILRIGYFSDGEPPRHVNGFVRSEVLGMGRVSQCIQLKKEVECGEEGKKEAFFHNNHEEGRTWRG